jgi:hypothetical protein
MYKVEVDIARNRLYLTLVGFFSIEEIKRSGDETIKATSKLRRGYDVITDISNFKPGTKDIAKDIQRVQAHFQASGARQGVRIVGKSAIASMQFNRIAKDAGWRSTTVETLAAAEEFLAAP